MDITRVPILKLKKPKHKSMHSDLSEVAQLVGGRLGLHAGGLASGLWPSSLHSCANKLSDERRTDRDREVPTFICSTSPSCRYKQGLRMRQPVIGRRFGLRKSDHGLCDWAHSLGLFCKCGVMEFVPTGGLGARSAVSC